MVKVFRSFVRGPLESYVTGFAGELLRQGYTANGAARQVSYVAHLDRWLSTEALGAGDLTAAVIDRYLAERRSAGYVDCRFAKAMRPLLEYLGPLGLSMHDLASLVIDRATHDGSGVHIQANKTTIGNQRGPPSSTVG